MSGLEGERDSPAPGLVPDPGPLKTGFHLVALAALLVALVVPRWSSPQFTDTDAAVHAMTGVFFLDLAADRPAPGELMRYAQEYYAHYPALGLVIYPPLVPLSFAPAYALFGISATTARAVILLYAILFAWSLYFWVRREAGSAAGIAAAILAAMNPEAIRWSSEVMLEIPACAFMTLALWAWSSWLDSGPPHRTSPLQARPVRSRPLGAFAAVLALVAAIHAKQTAGFIALPMAIELVRRRGLAGLKSPTPWLAAGFGLALLLPLAALTRKFGAYGTVQLDPATYGLSPWTIDYWTQWARQLPDVVPGAVLIAAILALVLRRYRGRMNLVVPALSWFATWYVVFSWIPIKTLRFATFALPALGAVGSLLLARPFADELPKDRRGGRIIGIVCVLTVLYAGSESAAPTLGGYEAAATHAVFHSGGRPVLFDDYHSANFIYETRRQSTREEPAFVLRGSKVLTATASGALRTYPQVTTTDSFHALLDRTGVEWIYVEDWPGDSLALEHSRWLRDHLASDTGRFALEARFPVTGSTPSFTARFLLAYRYLAAPSPPDSGVIELFVPSAGMTIQVPLKRR